MVTLLTAIAENSDAASSNDASGLDWAMFVVAIIGLAGVFGGVLYAGRQLRQSRLSAGASLLLQLDEAFVRHRDSHWRLRPEGDWHRSTVHPANPEELRPIEEYMGLFERIEVMIESKMLDTSVVNRLYGYRVANVLLNHRIRQLKLAPITTARGWEDFLRLVERLEADGRSFHDPTECKVAGCAKIRTVAELTSTNNE